MTTDTSRFQDRSRAGRPGFCLFAGRRRGPRVTDLVHPRRPWRSGPRGDRGREHEGGLRRIHVVDVEVVEFVQDRHLDPGLGPAQRGQRAVQRVHGPESSATTMGRRHRSACRSRWGPTRASGSRLMPGPARASPSSRSGCSIRTAGGSVGRRKSMAMPQASRVDHAGRDVDPDHGPAAGSRDDRGTARLQARSSGDRPAAPATRS